jgi:hypothetical protein
MQVRNARTVNDHAMHACDAYARAAQACASQSQVMHADIMHVLFVLARCRAPFMCELLAICILPLYCSNRIFLR